MQANILSFMQAREPERMVPTKPKLKLSTISSTGSVVTLEDFILIDKDKPNRTRE
jgi:hypothetical protein